MNRGKFIPKILKHYGVVYENSTGWTCEVNLVSWNGGEPRIDIREWAPDKSVNRKVGTFTPEATVKLSNILSSIAEARE